MKFKHKKSIWRRLNKFCDVHWIEVMLSAAILVIGLRMLTACGDDRPPTYREAYTQYSVEWCGNAAACAPEWFIAHYDGERACVVDQVAGYCDAVGYCEEPYPDDGAHRRVLAACLEDQAWWPCGEWLGPITCYEAFP